MPTMPEDDDISSDLHIALITYNRYECHLASPISMSSLVSVVNRGPLHPWTEALYAILIRVKDDHRLVRA
jgi:hypothetical protein